MRSLLLVTISFISVVVLTACGENFSVANVSLGGSGSGTQKPLPGGGNGGGSNPSTGDKDEAYEYVVTVPQETQDTCMGIQRNLRLIDAESKQPLPLGHVQPLNITPLQIEIKNTTPNYVYQLTPLCRPIEYQIDQTTMFHGQALRCGADQDELQVLRPYETRIYELDLNFAQTELPFTVKYNAFYQTELPKNDIPWEKCDVAKITVPIHKRRISKDIGTEQPPITLPEVPNGEHPEIPKGEKPE
ncbi:hypothetical protein [Acinetobacter colistiniresistens]|uniref:Lipoprotein n=1 Tax=Acinetobacter colistiniresistens TaxID=280145 RepID=S3TIK0_9GAMM|nr:hypothetical protein [Acinetobacter colistiniresistens]EPG35505.1 hypothetical protein F907_02873 [Acinetobacter colistiniresistens]TVT80911.1 hypothetical protein FPV60_11440 [Acinetobacter colistiniresistens]